MRAVHLKCPNCAASLDAPESAQSVQCSFCGTTCRIQHRTGIFDRPAPLPSAWTNQRQIPVVTVRHGRPWLIVATVVLPFLMIGVTFFFVYSFVSERAYEGSQLAEKMAEERRESWKYSGFGNPLLSDIDGDGVIDIVGHIRYLQKNDAHHVAALSGVDGSVIWQSDRFGDHSDSIGGVLAMYANTVIQGDAHGTLSGYQADKGTQKWKVSIGEKLDSLCGNTDSTLALHLADKSWLQLEVATGAINALSDKPENCSTVLRAGKNSQANLDYPRSFTSNQRHKHVPKNLESMTIQRSVRIREDGSAIALSYKTPGTRVPMIAFFKAKGKSLELKWSAELPASAPLSAAPKTPEFVAANQTQLCSIYKAGQKSPHIVCFDREAGKRQWDTPLPSRIGGVVVGIDATDKIVLVGQWTSLDAFDAKTGKLVFSVGK